MSDAASSCRSSVHPSAPFGVRTRRNLRRTCTISRRSPCLTVATVEDWRGKSLRIFRIAGPTNASPIGAALGGPLLHATNVTSSTAAALTFDMEPVRTRIYEFTSRTASTRSKMQYDPPVDLQWQSRTPAGGSTWTWHGPDLRRDRARGPATASLAAHANSLPDRGHDAHRSRSAG